MNEFTVHIPAENQSLFSEKAFDRTIGNHMVVSRIRGGNVLCVVKSASVASDGKSATLVVEPINNSNTN